MAFRKINFESEQAAFDWVRAYRDTFEKSIDKKSTEEKLTISTGVTDPKAVFKRDLSRTFFFLKDKDKPEDTLIDYLSRWTADQSVVLQNDLSGSLVAYATRMNRLDLEANAAVKKAQDESKNKETFNLEEVRNRFISQNGTYNNISFAFIDDNNQVCSCYISYNKKNSKDWCISILKNCHDPKQKKLSVFFSDRYYQSPHEKKIKELNKKAGAVSSKEADFFKELNCKGINSHLENLFSGNALNQEVLTSFEDKQLYQVSKEDSVHNNVLNRVFPSEKNHELKKELKKSTPEVTPIKTPPVSRLNSFINAVKEFFTAIKKFFSPEEIRSSEPMPDSEYEALKILDDELGIGGSFLKIANELKAKQKPPVNNSKTSTLHLEVVESISSKVDTHRAESKVIGDPIKKEPAPVSKPEDTAPLTTRKLSK